MTRRILIGAFAGAALAVAAMAAADSIRYHQGAPAPSIEAVERPLGVFQVDPSWILSGKPVFRGVETVRSPDGRMVSGLWACEGPTSFVWHFSHDETVHLLEGRVEVEYQGRRFLIEPGDTASFHAGTQAIWHVPVHAKKAYTLHQPGWLVRAWRKLGRLWEGQLGARPPA
jgi:uncharacterized cupin superfamily protein